MRAPSSDLYELIQRLNKEEKKKVTIHLKSFGKKGVEHVRLFNAIAKQKEYDESALKITFKASRFSAAKKRLYDLIMDVLLLFDGEEEVKNKLFRGLQKYDILYKKQLYSKARVEIYILEDLAEKYELFDFFPLIHNRIQDLEYNRGGFKNVSTTSFYEFLEKMELRDVQTANINRYRVLQDTYFFIAHKLNDNWENEIDELMKDVLFSDLSYAKSGKAKLAFHGMNLCYHSIKSNAEEITTHALECIKLYEDELCAIRPVERYIECLLNFIVLTMPIINKERSSMIQSVFLKIDNHIEKVEQNKLIYQRRILDLKAKYYGVLGAVDEGKKLIDVYGNQLLEGDVEIYNTLFFSFARICLFAEDYKKALAFIERSMQYEGSISPKRMSQKKLFILLIYAEGEQLLLLEHASRSLYRKLSTEKEVYEVELLLIKLIKYATNLNSKNQKKKFEDLHKKLIQLEEEGALNEKYSLEEFDYITWAESKLKNQPMTTILGQKIANS